MESTKSKSYHYCRQDTSTEHHHAFNDAKKKKGQGHSLVVADKCQNQNPMNAF